MMRAICNGMTNSIFELSVLLSAVHTGATTRGRGTHVP